MAKQIKKFFVAGVFTVVLILILNVVLGYIGSQWTNASMQQASNNMGDQVAIRQSMDTWSLIWWATLGGFVFAIVLLWGYLYRDQLKGKQWLGLLAIVIALSASGCGSYAKVVIITPPNYGVVVNMSAPTNQAVGNNFDSGELLNVTTQTISMSICAVNSNDRCPDKIVAEVPGSPESRSYTLDKNSGTSDKNQALCFEASGANGCVDFNISAIILRDDAKCYANKMGVKPVGKDDEEKRYHYMATDLATALDNRVIQRASSLFAKAVATTSPLKLALSKFEIFEGLKPVIIKDVHDQTCITVTDLSINGGIVWSDQSIQDQINQATVLANQMELAEQQNKLLDVQNKAFIARALDIEKQFGLAAAIEFMRIQKWDGSYLLPIPAQPGSVSATPVPVQATPVK